MIKFAVFHLVLLLIFVQSRPIRVIPNAALLSSSPSIVLSNLTKNQCLCQAISNTSALNYFVNQTCQLFTRKPCTNTYELESNPEARLYLLDPSFDPLRPSCLINSTDLIRKMNTTAPTDTVSTTAQCLIIDNHGYLVTILTLYSTLERYDPATLTRIDQIDITSAVGMTLAYFNGAYFIGLSSNNIMVMNTTTLTVINTISSAFLQGPRDMIFLNNGQTMVVASASNDFLVFFNRSTPFSTLYSYIYRIPFSNRSPYGLWRVNDTFFYGTSFSNNTVLSYSAVNSSFWSETLVIDTRPIVSTLFADGVHVTIDECGRFWLALNLGGVLIYERDGSFLGRLSQYGTAFDVQITANFTIFISRLFPSQILRFQLDLNC